MRSYQNFEQAQKKLAMIEAYAALKTEFGANDTVDRFRKKVDCIMEELEKEVISIPVDPVLEACEPDEYEIILGQCDLGNKAKPVTNLRNRLMGAVYGRFAGCLLGVPVEGMSIEAMQKLAEIAHMPYPPESYWEIVDRPLDYQYNRDKRENYSLSKMNGVAVDDDITYTILGLLIMETYGFEFTTEDVGEYWKNHLSYACTAEYAALENLRRGIPAKQAALYNNPYIQWIGADIRADGFAYAAAGNPHLAAHMGYKDAYLSHRRNGIYGEMFWAAAEAAAFTETDPIEAIKIALREIPRQCALHLDVEWALKVGPSIKNYKEARKAVDERFGAMSAVHTNNNACLTIFGLMLGEGNFTKTISNTVAMGMDNDCTAATAGSVIGAIVGSQGIDPVWTQAFHDEVRTYIYGAETLSLENVVSRFERLAMKQPE